MKNKINIHSTLDELSGRAKDVFKTPDSSKETKIKIEIVTEPIREPTRHYFSSPCLLSEIDDNEDISNL